LTEVPKASRENRPPSSRREEDLLCWNEWRRQILTTAVGRIGKASGNPQEVG